MGHRCNFFFLAAAKAAADGGPPVLYKDNACQFR